MYNHGKYHLRAILKHLWYKLQFSLVVEDLISHTGGANRKESICQCRRHKRHRFDPWVGKIPWRRAWQPTPVSLPGESHGQRSLEGYSPQGCKEPRHDLSNLAHTYAQGQGKDFCFPSCDKILSTSV